jgi:phosphate:Na+ symporter
VSILTPLLTGLGLLFCGVRFIAANLAPLAGPAARRLFRRAVSTGWGAALAGVISGFVTQSTSAVTLVVVGFVRAGIIPERRAVLLPVWSQVGAAALVILVSLPTSAAVAYALAIAGTVLYFDFNLPDRFRHAVLVLLGAGLLFLGMETLKVASEPLRAWLGAHGLLSRNENGVLLFVIGLGLAVVTQSSTTAGAIAVAVVRAGVFDLSGGLLLLVGASVGSALNYGLPGWRHEAVGRHVMLFQAAQKLLGASLLSLLLLFTADHPDRFLAGARIGPAMEFAWTFLVTQIAGSLACTAIYGPLSRWLEKVAPPPVEETLARPAYLLDEALADPQLALDLVEREEQRLVERLPLMLDGVRAEGSADAPPAEVLRAAGVRIGDETRRYLAGVLEAEPDRQAVMRAMRLQRVLDNVVALHEAVAEFQRALLSVHGQAANQIGSMVESLHLLLEVLTDLVSSHDLSEQEMSLALLGDRRKVIEGLRARLMAASSDTRVQEALFRSTVLFERILWLARDTAVAVMQSAGESPSIETGAPAAHLAQDEASA